MRKLTLLMIIAFALLLVGTAMSADATYVGDAKCKGCHKEVHAAWSETGHATAFGKLSAEEQKDEKCIGCHITGKDNTGAVLEGVQCESCHGPGSEYKSTKVMSKKGYADDKEAQRKIAVEAGLVIPDEKVCVKCHTKEGNPNFKEFKFEERVKEVHPVAEGK